MNKEIKHIDVKSFDSTPIIEGFKNISFQARNLARASNIFDKMISDNDCTIILCLSGSLFSAGLKKVVNELIKCNIVDAIVSTGAIIVDQDFFEALGFKHYQGSKFMNDKSLKTMYIDRIYDTLIDENDLRICDLRIAKIAEGLTPNIYSSREFIYEMGRHLSEEEIQSESVVLECYRKDVPIFVPAFSDCSAGLGLVYYQYNKSSKQKVRIDSIKDFLELTKIKIKAKDTGLVMIGGGVPKNFAQDITVSADILGKDVNMHKYAIQISVADERDGGLSGSTLKEAHSWAKVDSKFEQMVFCEATIAFPLIASYVYHKGNWKKRKAKNYYKIFDEVLI